MLKQSKIKKKYEAKKKTILQKHFQHKKIKK